MLFNSNDFLLFIGVFLIGYVLVSHSLRLRNWLIVVASYAFYSWWDPRFTILLFMTTVLDFTWARWIEVAHAESTRRWLVRASVFVNIGVLCVFKYFNFFRQELGHVLRTFGADPQWGVWDVVLPVGISFYTFQSIGYVIDVYRRQVPACKDLIPFMAYVSFFPQLVAGPIERASNLLPQFYRTLSISADSVKSGLWLVVWGLFKKVVIADNLAPLVELVYGSSSPSGPMVLLGTIAFGLQIYCDFSGYTDTARGVARVLGFNLMLNFNLPYFATNLRDFWRRWHISLSTWLKDYLYIPLGGSRKGEHRTYLNLGITMLLGGLWHGASLTFLLWGLWHGLGLIASHAWATQKNSRERRSRKLLSWVLTQAFVLYAWMLFRAQSIDQVREFTIAFADWSLPVWWLTFAANLTVLAMPLLAIELWQWKTGKLDVVLSLPLAALALLEASLVLLTILFWQAEASPFIYFQF